MLKKIISLIISFAFILNLQSSVIYAEQNQGYEEIEKIIEEVAENKNIPPVILKAIAWKESNYRQFDKNGNPFVSYGNTGIMQVNKVHRHLDQDLLRNDIKYNIEAGADILLSRFNSMGKTLPKIGDMNPQVLENWYIPLWAYNGWSSKNNPNVKGSKAYQEQIFTLIRTKYNQPITSIPADVFPNSGLPSSDLHIETPNPYHDVSITKVDAKDIMEDPVVKEHVANAVVEAFMDSFIHPKDTVTNEEISDWIVDFIVN